MEGGEIEREGTVAPGVRWMEREGLDGVEGVGGVPGTRALGLVVFVASR